MGGGGGGGGRVLVRGWDLCYHNNETILFTTDPSYDNLNTNPLTRAQHPVTLNPLNTLNPTPQPSGLVTQPCGEPRRPLLEASRVALQEVKV